MPAITGTQSLEDWMLANGLGAVGDWVDVQGARRSRKKPASQQLSRAVLYMHHITADWKKRWILQNAAANDLTGVCLFGKPGRVLVEGPQPIVQQYARTIEAWPWKFCSLQGPWNVGERAFTTFEELRSSSEFKSSVSRAGLQEELKNIRSKDDGK
ncbi:unnamed protein product [Polarella glacialis]|nr:unnamed protein product [Polarella glacialis]